MRVQILSAFGADMTVGVKHLAGGPIKIAIHVFVTETTWAREPISKAGHSTPF